MEFDLPLRVIAVKPTPGCDFGVQQGHGSKFEVVSKRRSAGGDLAFDLMVRVKDGREDGSPNFLGPFAQGPPGERFLYLDVGRIAGQKDTAWERRVKIHLSPITWMMIRQVQRHPNGRLEARYQGTGKDGGPACGTVELLDGGWKVVLE